MLCTVGARQGDNRNIPLRSLKRVSCLDGHVQLGGVVVILAEATAIRNLVPQVVCWNRVRRFHHILVRKVSIASLAVEPPQEPVHHITLEFVDQRIVVSTVALSLVPVHTQARVDHDDKFDAVTALNVCVRALEVCWRHRARENFVELEAQSYGARYGWLR